MTDALEALKVLDEAGDAFFATDRVSVAQQIYLSGQCRIASHKLRAAIAAEHPTVKLEAA